MEFTFYQDASTTDNALRFGDVVRGFVLSTPLMDQPLLEAGQHEYQVDVRIPDLCVILSPCCSIKEQTISLAPLKGVMASFLDNPYLVTDMTNINRKMLPEQAMPPPAWGRMTDEDRQRKLAEGKAYAFVSYFVYAESPLFPSYSLKLRNTETTTRFHMVDFRDIIKVSCKAVISAQQSPVAAKLLQLSVITRKELREKIAEYYGRVPAEDKALLAALQA
jgi:hypothetical protein